VILNPEFILCIRILASSVCEFDIECEDRFYRCAVIEEKETTVCARNEGFLVTDECDWLLEVD